MDIIDRIIVTLALLGFVNAGYFTAVAYGWMRPDPRWLPVVCRLDETSCAAVVFTRQGRLFGPPNSVLGHLYYAAVIALVATGFADAPPWDRLLVLASLATVVVGAYLAWSLLFVIRVPCRLCFLGHAINLALAVLLLA